MPSILQMDVKRFLPAEEELEGFLNNHIKCRSEQI